MNEKNLISSIYKILLLYEDMPVISENDYIRYIDRVKLRVIGNGANDEIVDMLNGLQIKGASLSHAQVKSMVFHIISLIKVGRYL